MSKLAHPATKIKTNTKSNTTTSTTTVTNNGKDKSEPVRNVIGSDRHAAYSHLDWFMTISHLVPSYSKPDKK